MTSTHLSGLQVSLNTCCLKPAIYKNNNWPKCYKFDGRFNTSCSSSLPSYLNLRATAEAAAAAAAAGITLARHKSSDGQERVIRLASRAAATEWRGLTGRDVSPANTPRCVQILYFKALARILFFIGHVRSGNTRVALRNSGFLASLQRLMLTLLSHCHKTHICKNPTIFFPFFKSNPAHLFFFFLF